MNVRICDKHIAQRLEPKAYSGILTTFLMTFLPVAYKGRLLALFPVHMIRKRTSENVSPAESRTHDRCVGMFNN
jgi:hypothetical protein